MCKAGPLIARLYRHLVLAGWKVSHLLDPSCLDPANIEMDHDLKLARIRIHPEWQAAYLGALETPIAHELGRLLTDDLFRFVKLTPATREAEERLATRFGTLLAHPRQ